MNPVLQALHSMKTTHGNFNQQPVSEEQLQEILQAAVRAASASNRQSYSIIVVRDQEKIKQHFHFSAPAALLFCVDYNRVIDSAKHLDMDYPVNGVLSLLHGSVDALLAAENAAVAAHAIGVNRMLTNSLHRGDINALDQAFSLPEKYCFPLITLLLGFEDNAPTEAKGRLQGAGIIHQEHYQKLDSAQLDQLVATYDDPAQRLPVFADVWKPQEYDHYLQWYFAKWPNKPSLEKQQQMEAYLRQKGFLQG